MGLLLLSPLRFLSLPVIDGAARLRQEFNLDTVARDKTRVRENLEQAISKIISQAKLLPQTSQTLFRFLQLEEELTVDAAQIAGTASPRTS